MTDAWRTLILTLANKALIPHAESGLHASADARIKAALDAVEAEAYAVALGPMKPEDDPAVVVERARRAGL